MAEHLLPILYRLPSSAFRDGLWIEQKNPDPADGYLSRAGMYRSILALLNGDLPEEPDCVNDCVVDLYVYRYDLGLSYRLQASHGQLGNAIVEELYFTEKIRVSMVDELRLKYPNFGVVESRWLGDRVWNQDGALTTAPSFVATMDMVRFSGAVYGDFLITYKINRDRYQLALPAREASIENKYASCAFATYQGGIKWEPIEPPAGLEQTDQHCTGGGGSTTIGGPPDGRNIPVAAYADKKTEIDYCTQVADEPTYTEHVDWEYQKQ